MKLINVFSYSLLAVAFVIVFYIGYLAFYPFKTLVVKQPITILTPTVKAGDDMVYQISYCRYFKGSAQLSRTLVGPDNFPAPFVSSITKPGCGIAHVHLNVPASATPGAYHMEAIAEFQVNPFQLRRVNFQSGEFQVINH